MTIFMDEKWDDNPYGVYQNINIYIMLVNTSHCCIL